MIYLDRNDIENMKSPIAWAIYLWMRPDGAVPPCCRSIDTNANRRLHQKTVFLVDL